MTVKILTDLAIKALPPAAPHCRYMAPDNLVPSLFVRVTDKGHKTFVLYRRIGPLRTLSRRKLGTVDEITLQQARAKAREWLGMIVEGRDPAIEAAKLRQAELRALKHTFIHVAEAWFAEGLKGQRKRDEVIRDVTREFVGIWAARPIEDITASDVRAVIKGIASRAPYQAANCLGYLRRLFAWAIDQETYGLVTSPCERLVPKALVGTLESRTRALNDDELFALWRTATRLAYPYGPVLKLLMLTGARHNEIAEATRGELSLDAKLLTISEERFKSKSTHQIPLSDPALALFASLPQLAGPFLFSATTSGRKSTSISDPIKGKIDRAMLRVLRALARQRGQDPTQIELKPWVIHDLRRVVRSGLSALKVQEHIAEQVIGHGRKGLARIYDMHEFADEKRAALDLWSARLLRIVNPAPATDNIVPLRAGGR